MPERDAAGIDGRLAAWLASQLPEATGVRVEGLESVDVGHSQETLLLTVVHDDQRQDVVLRMRPPSPGLLEPYDLGRQFRILRGLDGTDVRAPRALWHEPTGNVLGREFYVMERLPGIVIERGVPEAVASDADLVRQMCESMVDQLAAIHLVDLETTGLASIADGRGYLEREIDHWAGELDRVKQGPLPALERVVAELREQQPAPCPRISLVHGCAKPGNFAFVDGDVSAVFDWEMTTVGDPLADIGWAEVSWMFPGYVTSAPGAPTRDELVAQWERKTGLTAAHHEWYRALGALKMATILVVGGHLYDEGHSDDPRMYHMAFGAHPLTQLALHDLGVAREIEPGPLTPSRPAPA